MNATHPPSAHVPDRRRPLRPLWRSLCPRNADARPAAAHASAMPQPATIRSFPAARLLPQALRRPALAAVLRRAADAAAGGARIFLKREDLNHTGAHKINNCIGQALLTRRMGKPRVIAETGAGQHGVATATAAALFGLECQVYMGEEDVRRQKLNVFKMRALGTRSSPSPAAAGPCATPSTRRCATGWPRVENTHYIIGSVVGPHPFPMMVRDFQSVIGRETREQCLEQTGRLPDVVRRLRRRRQQRGRHVLSVHRRQLRSSWSASRRAAEATQHGAARRHAQPRQAGRPARQLQLRAAGRRRPDAPTSTRSPPGLDYPGVGPEHSYWKDTGRVRYTSVSDAGGAGRLPPLLPAGRHPARPGDGARRGRGDARRRKREPGTMCVVVCFSGRGDKDCFEVARLEGDDIA